MIEKNESHAIFRINRIYTKDVLFEILDAPRVFQNIGNPDIKVNIDNNSTEVCTDIYEVVLYLSITAMINKNLIFICKVKQAGLFNILGFDKKQILRFIGVRCPEILFPYARECINSQISRGTFPSINLDPINFDDLFTKFLKNQSLRQL